MKLSVVVGTWNRCGQLPECLERIFARTSSGVQVWVTDAGTIVGTIEYLESIASERLIPIFVGKRLGQAKREE